MAKTLKGRHVSLRRNEPVLFDLFERIERRFEQMDASPLPQSAGLSQAIEAQIANAFAASGVVLSQATTFPSLPSRAPNAPGVQSLRARSPQGQSSVEGVVNGNRRLPAGALAPIALQPTSQSPGTDATGIDQQVRMAAFEDRAPGDPQFISELGDGPFRIAESAAVAEGNLVYLKDRALYPLSYDGDFVGQYLFGVAGPANEEHAYLRTSGLAPVICEIDASEIEIGRRLYAGATAGQARVGRPRASDEFHPYFIGSMIGIDGANRAIVRLAPMPTFHALQGD